jgi:PEP-CTERM motif-containing protein
MKQFTRWVLAALVAGAVFIAPRASAQNLVGNPGFETGLFPPWSQSAPGWNPANWAIDTNNPHNGAVSAHNFFDGGTFQNVGGIVAGQSYSFSGFHWLDSGGDLNPNGSANGWGSFVQMRWLNSSGGFIGGNLFDIDVDGQARDQWNQTSVSGLVAPTGATQARILFGTFTTAISAVDPTVHTVAQSYWDDFTLQIPEPGTYAMMALGLIAMIPVIRRRLQA